jgi:hypothetical protein
VDGTWQGSLRKHHYSTVKVSGKNFGGGTHPNSGASVGWCGVVAVDGSEAGSVATDDGALALHHGEREREVRWGLRTMGKGRD